MTDPSAPGDDLLRSVDDVRPVDVPEPVDATDSVGAPQPDGAAQPDAVSQSADQDQPVDESQLGGAPEPLEGLQPVSVAQPLRDDHAVLDSPPVDAIPSNEVFANPALVQIRNQDFAIIHDSTKVDSRSVLRQDASKHRIGEKRPNFVLKRRNHHGSESKGGRWPRDTASHNRLLIVTGITWLSCDSF